MHRRARLLRRIVVSLAAVAASTAVYFVALPVNVTTVALTYVLIVLLIATRWGIQEATVAAVAAAACLNFFFLPPFLTLTIADPQNWIAFVVFVLTAVIVGQLSGRAKQRQMEAAERARTIELAARAETARRSAELRAAVLDAIAHEFKTPLTAMKAATGGLLAVGASAQDTRELVEIVDEELNRLQALVTDAVRMLRIDAGDFEVRRERHALSEIVATSLGPIERRLEGHRIVNGIPPTLDVDVDRGLLELAIRQLLDNAVKYSPPNSIIELSAATNGTVTISVRNTGSVIPEPDRMRIFERFYRGSEGRRVAGSGMGLAIVRQIAEAHGGHVTVASTEADGTEFTLRLPRGRAHS
jgi:K+-sensing histidine kinase KdpD